MHVLRRLRREITESEPHYSPIDLTPAFLCSPLSSFPANLLPLHLSAQRRERKPPPVPAFQSLSSEAELGFLGFNPRFPGKESVYRQCPPPRPQGTLTPGPSFACGWAPRPGLELGQCASLGPPEAAPLTRLPVLAEFVV